MKFKPALSKITAILLALTMLMPMAVNAASFTDTAGHWAEESIEYMVKKNVLAGMGGGIFAPNDKVTRAQFIKMIDETFGLVATRGLSFNDVKSSDWYYPYISKAYAQGYLLDYGARITPDAPLTREEAVALLVRYLELPEDEAVSKSAFSDYSQIDSDYRDYVLQAVYAGIIVGRTSTTFDPKATLTRAEALAILCRAAGTVYDASASGLDAAAEAGNAVIKAKNITVKSADVKGNLIVTEGVNSGTTTLYKFNVGGTLYLRGASKLVISDSDIKELVVDTGLNTAVSITVEDSAKLSKVTFVSPASVELKDGTSITELTVGEKATGSSVTGKGSLGTAYINAARFRSEMMPQKYDIGDGLSATLAGTSMSGAASDYSGFTKTPTTQVKDGYDYLTFTAYKNGYVYYYYANSSAAPTSEEFKSTYSTTSNLKARLSTTANTADTEKAKASASAASYSHIVICFVDSDNKYYKPVVIKRAEANDGYGFSGDPTITVTTNGYDTLSATPLYTGKLYYYYTTSPNAPTANLFMTNYTASAVKNTLNVTANRATTQNLSYSAQVSSYSYVVIMLVDNNNKSYEPKVLARSANNNISALASGFNTAPSVSEINGYDYFQYNALATGTMWYYYSATSSAPTAANFMAYYNQISDATLKGTFTVSQASASLSERHHSTLSLQSLYPYVVFMLQTSSGSYTPYVATRGATANATASGFSSAPTVTNMGASDMISVTPMYSGTLRFYYTNSPTAPTAAEFNSFYSSYATNSAVPSSIANATAGQTLQAPFDLSKYTSASMFNYVVFMLQDSTTTYQPVVVQRSSNITNTQNSGFITTPTITSNASSTSYDQMTVYTNGAGTVYYYYTQNFGYIASDAATFSTYQMYNSTYSGTIQTTGYTTANTVMPTSISGSYYVVMMFVPSGYYGITNNCTPIYVYRNNTTGSSSSGSTAPTSSGFASNGTPKVVVESNQDRLQFTSSVKGTLYYYYSNTTTDNSLTFMEEYAKATTKDTTTVSSGVQRDYSVNSESKTYIVIMLIDDSNQMYKPTYIKRTSSSN